MREVAPGGALLPGLLLGDVRQGARGPAEREHAVLPALALRRREGLRPLHHGQLPRELRPFCLLRDTFQPRVCFLPTHLSGSRDGRRGRSRRRRIWCRCGGKGPSVQSIHARTDCSRSGTARTGPRSRRSRRPGVARPILTTACCRSRRAAASSSVDRAPPLLDADATRSSRRDVEPGDALALADEMPETPCLDGRSRPEMAELLGLLAADGYVSPGRHEVRFTNNDGAHAGGRGRAVVAVSSAHDRCTRHSGFDPERPVAQLELCGGAADARPVAARAALHARRLQEGPAARPQRRTRTCTRRSSTATTPATVSRTAAATRSRRTARCWRRDSCWLYALRAATARCTSSTAAGRSTTSSTSARRARRR